MPKLLIVEDEPVIRSGLALDLSREGYQVVTEERGDLVLNRVVEENPDLIVLDVMLPGLNGFDVCRELRRRGIETPVIMLTAKRTEEIDKVLGLEIGADDYVTKPFGIRELEARIRVQLRHSARRRETPAPFYRFGDVEIDFNRRRITRNGHCLELTSKESAMLLFLIEHRGELISRERLLTEIWGYSRQTHSRTLDTHILNLRKKVEQDPAAPRHLISIYGAGYQFKD
jgi:DNA-binding response OmpR family regulator